MHQDKPAVYGPKGVSPGAFHFLPGSHDAGMYTRSEHSSFWDSIFISAASRNALKKLSQKFVVFSNKKNDPGSFPYYGPRTDLLVGSVISPGYFNDRFLDTFGPVA